MGNMTMPDFHETLARVARENPRIELGTVQICVLVAMRLVTEDEVLPVNITLLLLQVICAEAGLALITAAAGRVVSIVTAALALAEQLPRATLNV